MAKQTIVLKLSGEIFGSKEKRSVEAVHVKNIAEQIKQLKDTHYFGIVVGGGNFFRGRKDGQALGIHPASSDYVGMLATVMNGVILQDIFSSVGLNSQLFSAVECANIAAPFSQQSLRKAMDTRDCIIFAGGTGQPFLTTDTAAVIRAVEMNARDVWKATKVDGLYTEDPVTHPDAKHIRTMSYHEVLDRELGVMDSTALTLAREHHVRIRIFSLFSPRALVRVATDVDYGSTITDT